MRELQESAVSRGPSHIIRIVALLTMALGFARGSMAHPQNTPVTHTVIIRQLRYNPQQLTIRPGDVVEWKNEDIYAHTATASDGSFDSDLIPPGGSWQTTIRSAGTIAYHCRPHPNMAGTLLVSAGGQDAAHATGSVAPHSLRWSPPTSPDQIHPILVNFTAALLPLSVLSDVLGRIVRRQSLHNAAWWMMFYEAMITPLTVAAGWWWRHSTLPSLPHNLITIHQWLGSFAAVAFIGLAAWRWRIQTAERSPGAVYFTFAVILLLALVYQGSLGGAMVFGK